MIPANAGFGDGGTFRSREEDRFDCGEKRARRGAGGRSAGRRMPIDRVWNETVTVGLGSMCCAWNVLFD